MFHYLKHFVSLHETEIASGCLIMFAVDFI